MEVRRRKEKVEGKEKKNMAGITDEWSAGDEELRRDKNNTVTDGK